VDRKLGGLEQRIGALEQLWRTANVEKRLPANLELNTQHIQMAVLELDSDFKAFQDETRIFQKEMRAFREQTNAKFALLTKEIRNRDKNKKSASITGIHYA